MIKREGFIKKNTGFTLIELLVVVAIIAVLISILLPSLNSARSKAKDVSCQSNLHQLGMFVLMYADAYNDTFSTGPRTYDYYGDNNFDAGEKLCQFVGWKNNQGCWRQFDWDASWTSNEKMMYHPIFRCPSTPGYYGAGGYSINAIATYYNAPLVSQGRLWGSPAPGGKRDRIPNPDKCFLYADVIANQTPGFGGYMGWPENSGCIPDVFFFARRHSDGANVVHWDGSVKNYGYSYLYGQEMGYWNLIRIAGAGLDR
jgi:prepilin-type N-terminal cleavage/methylation domain-containing protein/prepilin-type processing-associated H-X9-DG protein